MASTFQGWNNTTLPEMYHTWERRSPPGGFVSELGRYPSTSQNSPLGEFNQMNWTTSVLALLLLSFTLSAEPLRLAALIEKDRDYGTNVMRALDVFRKNNELVSVTVVNYRHPDNPVDSAIGSNGSSMSPHELILLLSEQDIVIGPARSSALSAINNLAATERVSKLPLFLAPSVTTPTNEYLSLDFALTTATDESLLKNSSVCAFISAFNSRGLALLFQEDMWGRYIFQTFANTPVLASEKCSPYPVDDKTSNFDRFLDVAYSHQYGLIVVALQGSKNLNTLFANFQRKSSESWGGAYKPIFLLLTEPKVAEGPESLVLLPHNIEDLTIWCISGINDKALRENVSNWTTRSMIEPYEDVLCVVSNSVLIASQGRTLSPRQLVSEFYRGPLTSQERLRQTVFPQVQTAFHRSMADHSSEPSLVMLVFDQKTKVVKPFLAFPKIVGVTIPRPVRLFLDASPTVRTIWVHVVFVLICLAAVTNNLSKRVRVSWSIARRGIRKKGFILGIATYICVAYCGWLLMAYFDLVSTSGTSGIVGAIGISFAAPNAFGLLVDVIRKIPGSQFTPAITDALEHIDNLIQRQMVGDIYRDINALCLCLREKLTRAEVAANLDTLLKANRENKRLDCIRSDFSIWQANKADVDDDPSRTILKEVTRLYFEALSIVEPDRGRWFHEVDKLQWIASHNLSTIKGGRWAWDYPKPPEKGPTNSSDDNNPRVDI
jgi:hypothetical protein